MEEVTARKEEILKLILVGKYYGFLRPTCIKQLTFFLHAHTQFDQFNGTVHMSRMVFRVASEHRI